MYYIAHKELNRPKILIRKDCTGTTERTNWFQDVKEAKAWCAYLNRGSKTYPWYIVEY